MIRHASPSPAKPIVSLAHPVSPSASLRPLVASIGRTALLSSGYLSARLSAIALAAVAMAADAEDRHAGTTMARSKTILGHHYPSSPNHATPDDR